MKDVFMRVGDGYADYAEAEKHMQSLGYTWYGADSLAKELQGWGCKVLVGNEDGRLMHSDTPDFKNCESFEEIFLPSNKHKHHDLIVKWAANTAQKVWYKDSFGWKVATTPAWGAGTEYHIGEQPPAPPEHVVTIAGKAIATPAVKPVDGTPYFVPNFGYSYNGFSSYVWHNDNIDNHFFERKMVHLTKEGAIEHAKALIAISGGSV